MGKFYKESFFETPDGAKINYVDVGKGNNEVIFLIHGWLLRGNMFEAIGKALSRTHRVIWLDLRGHGKTVCNGPFAIEHLASDVKSLIEYLNIDHITLLGYSLGAHVLFQYVRDYGCLYLKKAIILDMTPKILNDDEWSCGLYQGNYKNKNYQNDLILLKNDYNEFFGYFLKQLVFKHLSQ